MEKKEVLKKCINCKNEYGEFMFSNYNLDLCNDCFEKFNESEIQRDDSVDKVFHIVKCPKCRRIYKKSIVDQKCRTKKCNVWFFWDDLDCHVIARWIDLNALKAKNESLVQ